MRALQSFSSATRDKTGLSSSYLDSGARHGARLGAVRGSTSVWGGRGRLQSRSSSISAELAHLLARGAREEEVVQGVVGLGVLLDLRGGDVRELEHLRHLRVEGSGSE